MPMTQFIALGLALSTPLSAHASAVQAAPDEAMLRDQCSAFSQAGIRECLAAKEEDSQKALTQAEIAASRTIGAWDEDAKYIAQSRAKLIVSNREFIRYRQAQCAFNASLGGGSAGNSHEIGRLACVTALNGARTEQLNYLMERLLRK